MTHPLLRFAITLALLVPISASAGTKIINQDSSEDQLSDLYIQDGLLATMDEQGKTQFIYDNKTQSMTVLQHDEKHYMQLDQQSLAAMAGGLSKMRDQAMSMMQEQMAGLSAEQRQQMEKMMGKMMPAPAQEKSAPEVVQTDRNDQVNGVSCRWIELRQEGNKISEACVAKLSDTKLNEKDYQTLQGFFNVIEKVANEFGGADQDLPLNKFMFDKDRVPLKLMDYADGSSEEFNLKFIPGSFDVNLFKVPKDYKLQNMPDIDLSDH